MTTPVTVKRRRLVDASTQLKKPFVSPMRAQQSAGSTTESPGDGANDIATISTPVRPEVYSASVLQEVATPLHHKSAPDNINRKPESEQRDCKRRSFPLSSRQIGAGDVSTQRAIASLETQIRQVQKNIDTIRQAKQISTSLQDTELEALTEKWRLSAQAVAEELFGTVKERVCRMGGVAAWRETEKRKHDRHRNFSEYEPPNEADDDADCEFDSQGEELSEAEQEYRKKAKRQARQEMMDAADVPSPTENDPSQQEVKVWQEDGAEDDVSTE
jgi:hypothetical protein